MSREAVPIASDPFKVVASCDIIVDSVADMFLGASGENTESYVERVAIFRCLRDSWNLFD